MIRLLITIIILNITTLLSAQDRPVGEPFATRSEVLATHGMAATSQPLATQVALDILNTGVQGVEIGHGTLTEDKNKLSTGILSSLPATDQIVLVRAARMLDVEGGQMVSDAAVLVKDGKIAAINPETVSEKAEIIDLGDMTLLPGLIDVNVHLNAPCPVDQPIDPGSLTKSQSLKTLCMLVNARKALLAGFTTLRALGDPSFYPEVAYASLATAADKGWIDIPHIVPGTLFFRADAMPPPGMGCTCHSFTILFPKPALVGKFTKAYFQ